MKSRCDVMTSALYTILIKIAKRIRGESSYPEVWNQATDKTAQTETKMILTLGQICVCVSPHSS